MGTSVKKPAIAAIFVLVFSQLSAVAPLSAEYYNEDECYKGCVTKKDGAEVVLALNRETNDVELYWSDEKQDWIKPDRDNRRELQRLYDRKLRLRNMQEELDRMRSEQRYTNEDLYQPRGR
jgi:hypothetical protein